MKDKNLDKLISSLSKQLGVSENQIKNAAQNGNVNDILKNADSNQTDKIKSVLNDPEKTKEILNSPQAQALIKLLGGDNKN
ncbi:hypothetical protein [uncultured Ruminococcus sp.]|uniref:hypothetical protein n=1 Tax=uncultured Ruminococcus sp. TaxID=165186 RepID=UPI0025EA1464|nr:hypothetical protein [uncultured Ruminococcus sp.]